MRSRPRSLALVFALVAIVALALVPGAGVAKPAKQKYEAFGSCANGSPYEPARHCHYDHGRYFRGTLVFKSHTGKHPVKVCFRLYGSKPLGGGHACAKLKPLAYKAYPFKILADRPRPFSVKVTWYVKDKKGKDFRQVAASFMRVNP